MVVREHPAGVFVMGKMLHASLRLPDTVRAYIIAQNPIHVRSIDLESRYPKFIETAPAALLQRTRQYVQAIIGIQ